MTSFFTKTFLGKKKENSFLGHSSDQPITTYAEEGQLNTKATLADEELCFLRHDLKSPIRRIESLIGLLMDGKESENVIEYLTHINNEIKGFQEMIGGFSSLLLTQQHAEDAEVRLNLHAFFATLYAGYRKIGQDKGILLLVDIFPAAVQVSTRQQAFSRIADNLISNAIKFGKKGSTVKITIRTEQTDLIMKVTDEGPGISSKDLKVIFGKFQRGTAQPTGNESSSGIGLYLVKTLADQLSATIQVDSIVGKGTSFTLKFPGIVLNT